MKPRILLLAPQPFYQERGTPIAVRAMAAFLASKGAEVDLLTLHEGTNPGIAGVRIHRIPNLRWIRRVPPGFSLQKLVCDVMLFCLAQRMVRFGGYSYVHAVEESVFFALFFRWRYGVPYVYDMDSSMPEQMAGSSFLFRALLPLLRRCEAAAVRHAMVVVPVCDALAELARRGGARQVALVRDAPLIRPEDVREAAPSQAGPRSAARQTRFTYIGNLAEYQGIELLLRSFQLALQKGSLAVLTIVGGTALEVEEYQQRCRRLQISERVSLIGSQPIERLRDYLVDSDVLVSPRLGGNNTPMKIYTYLQSGKPILATRIPAHTQVLSAETAWLVEPEPAQMAQAIAHIAEDATLRAQLGRRAQAEARARFSAEAHAASLEAFWGQIVAHVAAGSIA